MGFISNLFSKRSKNIKTVSNEPLTGTDESLSVQKDKYAIDYSQLSYDSDGWMTYPDGLRCRNVSQMLNDSFDERLFLDVIVETKEKLGYKDGELFYYLFDENNNNCIFHLDKTFIIGIWELFTNKLICFIRRDSHVMNQKEIQQYKHLAKREWDNRIWGDKIERGQLLLNDIWGGINEKSIRQEFVENVFDAKAVDGTLATGKFVFTFEDGLLSSCDFDGYNVMVFETFTGEEIDEYLEHSNKHHFKSEKEKKALITLQAICWTKISQEILSSEVSCKKFAYDEWGLCINYIAMGTFYHQFDMDQDTFVASTDGMYEILSNNISNGIKATKIKAYGEVFTFTNGHSMPAEVIGKTIAKDEEICNSTEGYIYVMTNSSIDGQVKIGKTTRDPYERAKELSSATGVPTPFVVVFYKPFKDCHFAEKIIHQYLEKKGYRVSGNREFFSMTTTEAIDVVQSMYKIEQEKT